MSGWQYEYFPILFAGNTIITPAGIFIYDGVPASGNLIGSWTDQGGTDGFGNQFGPGLTAIEGNLSGFTIDSSIFTNANIESGQISSVHMQTSTITGTAVSESTIVFDTSAGYLEAFISTTTTVTFTTPGTFNWTVPAGVSQAKVEAWGAGGGASAAGASRGGFGGGAGEYAQEPNYPVTAGNVMTGVIGAGGLGIPSGPNAGNSGSDTTFDVNGAITANGGLSGPGTSQLGGTGSTNTIHHNGGTGGTPTSSGGAGGGGSGGATGSGGNGTGNAGTGSVAGGAAGSGGGAVGGASGANTANGSNGNAPGAGGGGAGAGVGTTNQTLTYSTKNAYSYYGSDATNGHPSGLRTHNSTCYQGFESASGGGANGSTYSYYVFDWNQIKSDFTGFTLDSGFIKITNQHSWFSTGMNVSMWFCATGNSPGAATYPLTNDTTDGQNVSHVNEGHNISLPFSAITLSRLSAGTQRSFRISDGPPGNGLDYYGYFSDVATLSVSGHSGVGAPTVGGAGANGQVKITYTSGSALGYSISPVAFTDANSNVIPAGAMGPSVAIDPVALNKAETWHTVTLDTGWTAVGSGVRYKLLAQQNAVWVEGGATHAAFTVGTNLASGSNVLPAAYRPNANRNIGGIGVPGRAGLEVTSAGILVAEANGTSCTEMDIDGIYPLD